MKGLIILKKEIKPVETILGHRGTLIDAKVYEPAYTLYLENNTTVEVPRSKYEALRPGDYYKEYN